jgi:HTH-type transcriptional regulator/antitoxin HigA
MRTTIRNRRVSDHYLELVKRFPLRSIKSQADHKGAIAVISKLAVAGVGDEGSLQYIETLAQLIEDYERGAGLKIALIGMSPVRALGHLMAEHGLTVTQLGRIIGSQGTLSDVLAGRRELSKNAIRKLATYFGVSPAVFL